jgi:TonB-dependent SusC/RagA subfamily outer membrane receptor
MKKNLLLLAFAILFVRAEAQETKNEPLIVVNGMQTGLKVSNLDIQSIESINVLNGEAATAIYGVYGKNGVIQIRTKENVNPLTIKNHVKDPLVIVDGKELDKDINSIDPSQIKVVSVIKSGPALEKYGEKGKNGVIVIETKSKEKVL